MANERYKQIVREVLTHFQTTVPTGGHYPSLKTWVCSESRYGIRLQNCYFTSTGTAVFFLFFRWDEPLSEFKLHLVGKRSAYVNKLHSFKSALENAISKSVEYSCQMQGALEIFSTDPEP